MTTINISKTELLSHLQSVSKIIPAKTNLPILSSFLFELENDQVVITGAGHIGQITTVITNALVSGSVKICLEAKILMDALKVLPEQPLLFEINEENLQVTIKYHGGKFELIGKLPEQFPTPRTISQPTEFSVSLDVFTSGISKTIISSANDELRPIMNTVLIEIEAGQINHVASDGHTLALLEQKESSFSEKSTFALPKEIASILIAILPNKSEEQIAIQVGTSNVCLEYGSLRITAQLQEGRFPNYRSVIPQSNNKQLSIDTNYFKNALSRVMVFSNQSSKLVKFELSENTLLVSGQDIDFSTCAEEKVICEYNGSALTIGFNASLLHQLLKTITAPNISMSFSEPSKAALIFPSDNDDANKLTYLIMPLMLI